MKKAWNYLFAEPFTWIFYVLFQPERFEREIESKDRRQRLILMLRLVVPMFVLAYPIGVIGGLLLILFEHLPHPGIAYILLVSAGGILTGIIPSIAYSIMEGVAGGIVTSITIGIISSILFDIMSGITIDIVGGIIVGIVVGNVFGIMLTGLSGRVRNVIRIASSIVGGITFGVLFGLEAGRSNTQVEITIGFAIALSFILFFLIGQFRLLIYLVSGPSALRSYRASRRNPSQVFAYLQRSSLYWDELVYLPLPGLKKTLLIAYDQDPERALDEITFIATERPRQIRAAREALLDIAVRDLTERKKMTEIADAADFLAELFPQDTKLLDPQWATPITRLREASQDAARFTSPLGRRAKLEALQDMIRHIKGVRFSFGDAELRDRFALVVDGWLAVAQQEQEKLEQLPAFIGTIYNPYNPGNALKPNDPLFLGRLDLVHVLEMELSKGAHRPTFLMIGERRMGKSSTLLQLPRLLGSRYLPIFYDLQSPGIFASTPTFLGTLAEGIYKEMKTRNLPVDRLVYRSLRDTVQTPYQTPQISSEGAELQFREASAPAAYNVFDNWLRNVESVLEREDRTLLLLFDEFEKLEEAGSKRAFDLPLLLDWFRNIIQYHPRIALLFSGIHTLSEMGKNAGLNWSGYFVNVQTLPVSFLHEDEARRLITEPIPDFPGQDIYSDGVVEEILTQTGCHPFLVQAVCSALIDYLNAEKKERAELEDVSWAIDRTFTNWWDTYFQDLWIRTDEPQRACLLALRKLTIAGRDQIQRESKLDDILVRRTLQALRKRDLVHQNKDETYTISTPIFSEWVERSMYM